MGLLHILGEAGNFQRITIDGHGHLDRAADICDYLLQWFPPKIDKNGATQTLSYSTKAILRYCVCLNALTACLPERPDCLSAGQMRSM